MGQSIGLFVAALIVLYFLSRSLTQNLYVALFLLTKSREVSVGLLSFLFFPGTVVHELAHLFVAEILGVRTGGLTLTPEAIESPEVRTGSVAISQTDPVRRAIIGLAPVFVGLGGLFLLSYFLPGLWEQTSIDIANGIAFSQPSLYYLLLALYGLFAVSNTMFSSPEDMEGFWPVFIIIALIAAASYMAGIRITLPDTAITSLADVIAGLAINVAYITGFNVVLFGVSQLLILGVEKATGRRFVRKK